MSVELHADDGAARPLTAFEQVVLGLDPRHERRPLGPGELDAVLSAAPMFRRTVAGYDRFQVDTYVRWAEDEIATAAREREHLVERHLEIRAELEEARRLLSHSTGGAEFLRLSSRIGSLLAVAADEAESIRAEARTERTVASEQAEQTIAQGHQLLAEAESEAQRRIAEAATMAEEMVAEAGRLVDEAEQTGRAARAEAEARLEKVRLVEQRAAEQADRIRGQALAEASAARLHARDEVVRMLDTAREQRRRADADATATRERLDRDAETRRESLRAEVAALERRRATLRAQVQLLAATVPDPAPRRPDVHLRRLLERSGWRPRSLRAP
jgi:cell division septum initiation protein DivIVA